MKKSVMRIKVHNLDYNSYEPDRKEFRFTSRNIKKYSGLLNVLNEDLKNNNISDTIKYVLSIADRSRCKVLSIESLIFIKEFYCKSYERLNYLGSAPKNIRRQYLATFNNNDNFNEVEIFMKAVALTGYSSFLTKLDSREKNLLNLPYDSCLITRFNPHGMNKNSEFFDKIRDAKNLLGAFIHERSFRDITPDPTEGSVKEAIHRSENRVRYHIRSGFNHLDNRVVLSTFYVLVDKFGYRTIEEIFERYYETNRPFNLSEIVDLASKWDEAQDYPIEWTLDTL